MAAGRLQLVINTDTNHKVRSLKRSTVAVLSGRKWCQTRRSHKSNSVPGVH